MKTLIIGRFTPLRSDSQEVLDGTLRSDLVVKRLVDVLDARVRKRRYVLALAADHGVCPFPAVSRAGGVEAARVQPATGPRVGAFLAEEFGTQPARWVEAVTGPWVYLSPKAVRAAGVPAGEVETALAARWPNRRGSSPRTRGRNSRPAFRPTTRPSGWWPGRSTQAGAGTCAGTCACCSSRTTCRRPPWGRGRRTAARGRLSPMSRGTCTGPGWRPGPWPQSPTACRPGRPVTPGSGPHRFRGWRPTSALLDRRTRTFGRQSACWCRWGWRPSGPALEYERERSDRLPGLRTHLGGPLNGCNLHDHGGPLCFDFVGTRPSSSARRSATSMTVP